MRKLLQFIGVIIFFGAWLAFWVYFRVGHGRTRVVLLHEDKVLVMKQWISAGKWGLPGGGLHKGEDPAEGAARELYEETSLKLDPRQLRPVGIASYRKYGHRFDYQIFVAKVGSKSVRAQRIEVAELEWLQPEALNARNASPDTLQALEMALGKRVLQ
jgi:8-oxo-dGTP pyrophosphatase MutT (NUDIX family)